MRARAVSVGGARLLTLLLIAGVCGCASLRTQTTTKVPVADTLPPLKLQPSNHRNWEPSLAVLPRAEWQGEEVTVRNIRRFTYLGEHDYVMHYYDKSFRLEDVETVDFLVVPFKNMPTLAHTMLSFGLRDGDHIGVSVEVRLEEGQKYSVLLGALHQFEITYVVGDERDLILLRTEHRDVDVYLYPTRATPEQARDLFVDVMRRVNKLREEPEFYDTLTNNCTSNIVQHINRLHPGRIPFDVRWLLPGYSDRLAYDLGLLDTTLSFEEARRRARINELATRHRDDPDFSRLIRQHFGQLGRGVPERAVMAKTSKQSVVGESPGG